MTAPDSWPRTLEPDAVAVVVAAHNRPHGLRRCLEALAKQTVSGFEVVVVDDGSVRPIDGAIPGALRHRLQLRLLRFERAGGPARARNAGVAATRARRVLFVDDDVEPHPRLIERHLMAAAPDAERTVVIGPLAAPHGWRPTPWNRWEWRQLLGQYRALRAGVFQPTWRQFYTGNASVSRAAFEAAGGFDERFTRAEDIELAMRLDLVGCRFVFEAGAVGWHHAERTLASWLQIPHAYGRYEVAIARLHPECDWIEHLLDDELPRRKFARWLDRLAYRPRLAQALSGAAARAGALLAVARFHGLSGGALSAAYDLAYRSSLYAALRQPEAVLDGPRVAWRRLEPADPAGTGGQPGLHTAPLG